MTTANDWYPMPDDPDALVSIMVQFPHTSTATTAGQHLRSMLTASADTGPTDTVGVLVDPLGHGMFELGRVDWTEHPHRYATTVVLADGTGRVFAVTMSGDREDMQQELAQVDLCAMDAVDATPKAMRDHFRLLRKRFECEPSSGQDYDQEEALVYAVRWALPHVAAGS